MASEMSTTKIKMPFNMSTTKIALIAGGIILFIIIIVVLIIYFSRRRTTAAATNAANGGATNGVTNGATNGATNGTTNGGATNGGATNGTTNGTTNGGTTNGTAGTGIYYGDVISLQNQWDKKLLLSSCGIGGDCGTYNASLRTDTTAPTTSQLWRIYNDNKTAGQPVLYGDVVRLKNQYSVQHDLGACGSTGDTCGVNVVVGRQNPDVPSETWTVEGKTAGTAVNNNDIITLRNHYNNLLLSSCGIFMADSGCGVNVSLRTDNSTPTTQHWQIKCVRGTCNP